MCLQYRHLTDTVYSFSLLSHKEESVRSKVSIARTSGPNKKFNMQQIIMHGKM